MVRLKGFEKLTSVDDALNIFLVDANINFLGRENVSLKEAYGRVLASDVKATINIPPFDKSAMDGYALKARDTVGASIFSPKRLKITLKEPLGSKEAKRIWTGNPIPTGADAVIEQEQTRRVDEGIEVMKQIVPGENISREGEDVKKDQVALRAGLRLKPQHIGLAASLGLTSLEVAEKPKIAIISTGDEIVPLGEKPGRGKIVDSNKHILSGMCLELGSEPIDGGILMDNISELKSGITRAAEKGDMVITTGGTSVGRDDLVPSALEDMNDGRILIHGVAMRPGMPTALGVVKEKPFIALSGNPVAAVVGFETFARPAILRMLGSKGEERPALKAKMTRNVASTLGFRVFLRVKVSFRSGEFLADPIRVRGSSVVTTITKANGYVLIPEDREGLIAGEEVLVHLFDSVEIK